MVHEFLQVARCNGGWSPVLLRHGSRRKEVQHLQYPGIASYFPFLFFLLYPFFILLFFFCPDTGKEVRIEWQMGARVTASFEPRNIGGQATEPSQT
jgi:uncharacterized BrkB/YihY/UPF0761 family membrane protein